MRLLKSSRFNIEAITKLIILLGFALFFFITIKDGNIQLFVHPRLVPYMKFGIIAMIVISLFILGDVFKPQRRKVNLFPYLFFIIPLFMAFSLPAKALDPSSMSFNSINSSQQINDAKQLDTSSDDNAADNINDSNTSPTLSDNATYNDGSGSDGDAKGLNLEDDTIVINDTNFVQWIQELTDNVDKYVGKKIRVTGFVFKGKGFTQKEFVPARLMMVCCAADLQPIGLLAQYDKTADLKKDSWVSVTGKMIKGQFEGQNTLIISVDSVENAEKPKIEYVYPY